MYYKYYFAKFLYLDVFSKVFLHVNLNKWMSKTG